MREPHPSSAVLHIVVAVPSLQCWAWTPRPLPLPWPLRSQLRWQAPLWTWKHFLSLRLLTHPRPSPIRVCHFKTRKTWTLWTMHNLSSCLNMHSSYTCKQSSRRIRVCLSLLPLSHSFHKAVLTPQWSVFPHSLRWVLQWARCRTPWCSNRHTPPRPPTTRVSP